jgi:hypothetical protein
VGGPRTEPPVGSFTLSRRKRCAETPRWPTFCALSAAVYNCDMAHRKRDPQELEALAQPKGDPHAGLPAHALRPLEHQALAMLAKKAGPFRDALHPDLSQAVDFTVQVRGSIDVGNDAQATIKKKPDLAAVLAVVFSTMGKKARETAINEVVNRFGADDPSARGNCELELGPEWTGLVESLLDEITAEEKQHRRGNVTGSLTAEVLVRG